ncbi:hypothetical protein EVAR_77150_1 [Eumeta japonica]|uniref:Uncharacterized protein n=1 Tax=Eumeta variegata TaxID=151549 RepID=A0A4C1T203_EUMVA|nr:hypothetical protein EVAR_77150_1 [Eumeta japonica]
MTYACPVFSHATLKALNRLQIIQNKFCRDATNAHSSVRSPAPNGRYRAPAPSALTKLFAFCADRRPATPRPCRSRVSGAAGRHTPQLIIIYYFRSNRWLSNGVNEAICSEPWRWPFPFRERQTRTDLGPPVLRCSSPIPGVARPPSIIPHSILRTPLARIRSASGRSKKTNRESDPRLEPRLEPLNITNEDE